MQGSEGEDSLISNVYLRMQGLGWGEVKLLRVPAFQCALLIVFFLNNFQQAQHKKLFNSVTEVQIEAIEFEAGITYTARVRCKTSQAEESYKSHWSEWSQTTEFQRATTTGAKNVLSHFVLYEP